MEKEIRGRVAVDIVSKFLYTRFSLSLITNLAALQFFSEE